MMKQIWFCELCKQASCVLLDDPEAVLTAINIMDKDHQAVSPDCPNTGMNLRVLNVHEMLKRAEMPEWAIVRTREILGL